MRDTAAILTLRAYAADFGRVAYLSLCAVVAATLLLERIAPGVAGNVVSPQRLAAAAVLAGLLSLLAPETSRSGKDPASWQTAAFAATALIVTLTAFSAALAHFDAAPAAFAAAFCAALPFLAYARFDIKH